MATDPVESLARDFLRRANESNLDAGVVGYALMSCAAYVARCLGHQDIDAFASTARDAYTVVAERQAQARDRPIS